VALTWAAYEARNGTNIVEEGGDGESSAAALVGIEAQRSFMDNFSIRGLQNPTKAVTSKGFRERLVKGIIEDDLPYSLGEKAGMSKLFEYLLPRGISTPSHQTVRRDLDMLYENLDEKLNSQLQVGIVFPLCHACKLIPCIPGKPLEDCNRKRSVDQQKFRICICRHSCVLD
jgi:hypothetical protein